MKKGIAKFGFVVGIVLILAAIFIAVTQGVVSEISMFSLKFDSGTAILISLFGGVIIGFISFCILEDIKVNDSERQRELEEVEEEAQYEAKAKEEARTFLGKTWRVASIDRSLDDDYWSALICLFDAEGNRKIIETGRDHNSANVYFYLRPDDKVTFSITNDDQAEDDFFEASSFLIPTVVAMDIESLLTDETAT